MAWIAMAAALAALPANTVEGPPVLGGADFHRLRQAAYAQCARADVAHLTPSGLLQIEDDFSDGLAPKLRRRLNAALPRATSGRIAGCALRDGASCDAIAYLGGFRRAGLWRDFVAYACKPGMVR